MNGSKYGIRFQWVDDGSSQLQVTNASAYAVRGANADFAWGGYSSDLTKWVAMQNEANKILMMANGASVESIYADKSFVFGSLPSSATYHKSSVDGFHARCVENGLSGCEQGEDPLSPYPCCKFGFIKVLDSDSSSLQCKGAKDHLQQNGTFLYASKVQSIPKDPSYEATQKALESLRDSGVNIIIGCTFTASGVAIIEALQEMDYNV